MTLSYEDISKQYNNRKVPIIFEIKNKTIELNQTKYIVPKDISLAQFQSVIVKKISIKKHQGLIFFINNTLPKMTDTIGQLHSQFKSDDDQFLYIQLSKENAFG